jgi:hypothetical protein
MILIPAGEFQLNCARRNPSERCSSDQRPLHILYLGAYGFDNTEVTTAQ